MAVFLQIFKYQTQLQLDLRYEKIAPNYAKKVFLSPAIARGSCFHPVCLCMCVCLCLWQCLSGRFNYEGLVPHKRYFAGTLLGMSSCASYVSLTHDVTRSQSRSNFEIDISPSIFELQRRSKAQNVGNAHGYLSGIFNFWYNFRKKVCRELKMAAILKILKY